MGAEDHSFLGGAVHRALHDFAQAALKADGTVAGLAVPVLPFLEDGDDYGPFQLVGNVPVLQQFLFSHTSEIADHLGNAILPWGFLVF